MSSMLFEAHTFCRRSRSRAVADETLTIGCPRIVFQTAPPQPAFKCATHLVLAVGRRAEASQTDWVP